MNLKPETHFFVANCAVFSW